MKITKKQIAQQEKEKAREAAIADYEANKFKYMMIFFNKVKQLSDLKIELFNKNCLNYEMTYEFNLPLRISVEVAGSKYFFEETTPFDEWNYLFEEISYHIVNMSNILSEINRKETIKKRALEKLTEEERAVLGI